MRHSTRTRAVGAMATVVGVASLALGACVPAPLVIIDTVAGNGTVVLGNAVGDGGPATSASLNEPFGAAVDPQGRLVIADTYHSRLRRVAHDGTITTIAGDGTGGFSGDGGPAALATIFAPTDLEFAANGDLYVLDAGNNHVRRIDTAGTITTVAGNGTYGFSGDGGPAVAAALKPSGIDFDPEGRLVIADGGNHRVRRVDATGTITTVAGSGSNLYTGDNGPATAAGLPFPTDIAIDSTGTVYLAHAEKHRIRKIDPSGTVTTYAGQTTGAWTGDGGPAAAAQLREPRGIAIGPDDQLYIADTLNRVIRVIDSTGTIRTVAGNNQAGFAGDGGPPTQAKLFDPFDLTVTDDGTMYIADWKNHRIRRVWAGGAAIGGKVTDGGAALAGITVNLYDADDLSDPVATDVTSSSGWYGFSIPTGDYKVEFVGGDGHVTEWFDDTPDGATAGTTTLTAGQQLQADAELAAP